MHTGYNTYHFATVSSHAHNDSSQRCKHCSLEQVQRISVNVNCHWISVTQYQSHNISNKISTVTQYRWCTISHVLSVIIKYIVTWKHLIKLTWVHSTLKIWTKKSKTLKKAIRFVRYMNSICYLCLLVIQAWKSCYWLLNEQHR